MGRWCMNKNIAREIVEGIEEAADEILSKAEKSPMEQGQLIAYAESLCIIQDAFSGYDLSEIGLEYDVDAKYLYG